MDLFFPLEANTGYPKNPNNPSYTSQNKPQKQKTK